MPMSDVTVNATFSQTDNPDNAYYLTIEDGIDISFLIDTEYYGAEDGYIEYEYIQTIYKEMADRTDEPVAVSVESLTKHQSEDDYNNTAELRLQAAPAQIGEKYLIKVFDKNGVKKAEFLRSVEDYCNEIINAYSNHPELLDVKYYNLSKTILNYGQLANEYFEYAEKHKAINGVDDYTITTIGDYQAEFASSELEDINNNKTFNYTKGSKVSIIGVSYIAQLWPEFRFYISGVTEEEFNNLNVSVTGGLRAEKVATVDQNDEPLYLISVTGLYANQFGKDFTLTIGDTTIDYNGYAYLYMVTMDSESTNSLKAMVRGVYRYAKACEAAFGNN